MNISISKENIRKLISFRLKHKREFGTNINMVQIANNLVLNFKAKKIKSADLDYSDTSCINVKGVAEEKLNTIKDEYGVNKVDILDTIIKNSKYKDIFVKEK